MAVIRLLKTALPSITLTQIQPFFPIVSAYLCCAMTHIYDDIQADSLQILDVFLDTLPSLVIQSSNQILPNFIEQISRQKVSGKAETSRSLTVNPNSKLASQKWRSKVLERLHKLLSSIVSSSNQGDNSDNVADDTVVRWNNKNGAHCQSYSRIVRGAWMSPGYTIKKYVFYRHDRFFCFLHVQ